MSLWKKITNLFGQNDNTEKKSQRNPRQRRLAMEQLENRELLSITPLPSPMITVPVPLNNTGTYSVVQLPNGTMSAVVSINRVQYQPEVPFLVRLDSMGTSANFIEVIILDDSSRVGSNRPFL